jgi:hypothetical protein
MNLQEDSTNAGAAAATVADAIDAALAILADDHDGNRGANEDTEFGFQTPPAAIRRRKFSFVVTPPRINVLDHDDAAAATAKESITAPSTGRKRIRPALPPMLPGSPEFKTGGSLSDSNSSICSAFKRHVPIHSPIAGLTSVVNVEFMAKLMDTSAGSAQQPVEPRCEPLRPRHSFLAKHAFPILEEDDDETSQQQQQVPPAEQRQGLTLPRALKMRKRCHDGDLGFLQERLFA